MRLRPGRLAAVAAAGVLAWAVVAGAGDGLDGGPPPRDLVLRLEDAADLALQGSDRTPPRIARWRVREEEGRLWPSLSLDGRFSYETSQVVTRSDTTLLGTGANITRYGGGLGVSYNLFQYFESAPRIKGALAAERASVLRLSEAQADRVQRVTDAYLSLLAEQQSLAAFERLRREHVAFLRHQESRFAEDAVPMIEVVRARAQLVAADREGLAIRRRAASAELELRRLAGLRPDDRITLSFDRREVDLSLIRSQELPGLLELARSNNPRILAAAAAAESARWAVKAARTSYYPRLSVNSNGGYGVDEISDGIDVRSSDFRYSVFLVLSIPLFDGGVRRAQVAQSELTAQSRQHEAREIAEEVKTRVEDLYWAYIERVRARELLEQEVKLVEEELRQSTTRSDAGVGPPGEPLLVLSRLSRLRQDLARTTADVTGRGVALVLAVGRNPFAPSAASQEPLEPSVPAPVPPAVPEATPAPMPVPGPGAPNSVDALEIRRTSLVSALPDDTPAAAPSPTPMAMSSEGAGPGPEGTDIRPASTPAGSAAPDGTPVATTLESIDVARDGPVTTVAIRTDGPLGTYATFRLSRPSRFVIDLPALARGPSAVPEATEGEASGVRRVRVGRYQDRLRVVLDLADERLPDPRVIAGDDGLRIILGPGR